MKKILILITVFMAIFFMSLSFFTNSVQADSQSQLIQLKESQAKSLEDYQKKYNSESYGLTAYILHVVQVYSIPFCFLGIVISIIYKSIIGTRNLENAEKGLGMIVAIVTITIICQVLPLVFAIVVKMGKE